MASKRTIRGEVRKLAGSCVPVGGTETQPVLERVKKRRIIFYVGGVLSFAVIVSYHFFKKKWLRNFE